MVHPLAAEHLDTMCDVGSDVPSLKEKFGDDQRIDWSIVEARGAGGDGEWWYKPGDHPAIITTSINTTTVLPPPPTHSKYR